MYSINKVGLGVRNKSDARYSGNISFNSFFAFRVEPVLSKSIHNDDGGNPFISAKYVRRLIDFPSAVKNISPLFNFSSKVSFDQRQPFVGGLILKPVGDSIS